MWTSKLGIMIRNDLKTINNFVAFYAGTSEPRIKTVGA
jgi:hypothetical protein